MNLADQYAAKIAGKVTLPKLAAMSLDLWRIDWSALGDVETQRLSEAIERRKIEVRAEMEPRGIPPGRNSMFPPRRAQRSPDRSRSIERRRRLAFDRPLPPHLAARFTVGEAAILHIVADEVRVRGVCSICVEKIAAWAGTCRRLVQAALRYAARLGLVTIQERRKDGRKNETNLVRIISRDWLAWLRLHHGCKNTRPTETKSRKEEKSSGLRPQNGNPRKAPAEFAPGDRPEKAPPAR